MFGIVVDIQGVRRPNYFDVKAVHPRLSVTDEQLTTAIAEVKRVCPHLISAKWVPAHDCPIVPTPAGILFRFAKEAKLA